MATFSSFAAITPLHPLESISANTTPAPVESIISSSQLALSNRVGGSFIFKTGRSTVHRRKSLRYILMRLGLVNLSRLWGTNSCIKVWDPWVQRIIRCTSYRKLSKMSNQYHAYRTEWGPCSRPSRFARGRRGRRGDGKGQAQWEYLQKAMIS